MSVNEAKEKIGRIYRIHHCSDPSVFYVGSTTLALIKRLQSHKYEARSHPLRKSKWLEYLRSFNYEGFRIQLLEEVKFVLRQDLTIKEDTYIRQLKPCLNSFNAILNTEKQEATKTKWIEANRQHVSDYRKKNNMKFVCDLCSYHSYFKYNYERHLRSKPHSWAKENVVPPRILDDDE